MLPGTCRLDYSAVTLASAAPGKMTRPIIEDHKQVTDEMLMVRYQRGQRDAYPTLASRYASTLFSVGYYLLGSEAQADKLAQETLLQVVREAATFNLEVQFRAWLLSLLHGIVSETYSSGLEAANDPQSGFSAPLEPAMAEASPPSSRAYRSQILTRRVASRVASLPFLAREVFLFKQVGQLTISDTATAVGADIETVRHLIRLAFDRIQECVADTEEYARALR